jgi:hypothetical protein
MLSHGAYTLLLHAVLSHLLRLTLIIPGGSRRNGIDIVKGLIYHCMYTASLGVSRTGVYLSLLSMPSRLNLPDESNHMQGSRLEPSMILEADNCTECIAARVGRCPLMFHMSSRLREVVSVIDVMLGGELLSCHTPMTLT